MTHREVTETSEGREDRGGRQPGTGERRWGSSRIAGATATVTLTVLAIAAALAFLFEIRTILLWLLVGLILAVALEPGVAWLQRHRWNRALASLLVSIATIALLVGAVVAVAYPLVFQSDHFIRALPRLLNSLFGSGGSLSFLERGFTSCAASPASGRSKWRTLCSAGGHRSSTCSPRLRPASVRWSPSSP